jgi:hypothetical protein
MSAISTKVFWFSALASLAVAAGGCDNGDQIGVKASALNQWFGKSGFPAGMACGLAYTNWMNVIIEDGYCAGVPTLGTAPPADNFNKRSIGDRGLPSGRGFSDQASRGTGDAIEANSHRLALIRGTVCGFKETCNNSGELCMGHDPNIDCPAGWIRHRARDESAPSGCTFAWCSYLDQYQVCCDNNSCDPTCMTNMPRGAVCGLVDTDNSVEDYCGMDQVIGHGCPHEYDPSLGAYDAGRPAGHGLKWCTKR